jgi:hypothetical protein
VVTETVALVRHEHGGALAVAGVVDRELTH